MSNSFATPWTAAHQAPLSKGFSRQEYWSGLPCPSPGDLPHPRIKPTSLMSIALAGRFFTTSAAWETFAKRYQSLYILARRCWTTEIDISNLARIGFLLHNCLIRAPFPAVNIFEHLLYAVHLPGISNEIIHHPVFAQARGRSREANQPCPAQACDSHVGTDDCAFLSRGSCHSEKQSNSPGSQTSQGMASGFCSTLEPLESQPWW